MSKHTKDMDKIYSKYPAFEPAKQKSYYPGGRKKGAGLNESNDAYRDGWERIFGVGSHVTRSEPHDFDVK